MFWDPIKIDPDHTYFLVFTPPTNGLSIAGIGGDVYKFGNVYANPGFQSFSAFDYTFRTYADDGRTVPEPGTLVLLGLAAAGLAFSGAASPPEVEAVPA